MKIFQYIFQQTIFTLVTFSAISSCNCSRRLEISSLTIHFPESFLALAVSASNNSSVVNPYMFIDSTEPEFGANKGT